MGAVGEKLEHGRRPGVARRAATHGVDHDKRRPLVLGQLRIDVGDRAQLEQMRQGALPPGMSMGPWGLHYERAQTWWEQSRAWHEYLARWTDRGRYLAGWEVAPGTQ